MNNSVEDISIVQVSYFREQREALQSVCRSALFVLIVQVN